MKYCKIVDTFMDHCKLLYQMIEGYKVPLIEGYKVPLF